MTACCARQPSRQSIWRREYHSLRLAVYHVAASPTWVKRWKGWKTGSDDSQLTFCRCNSYSLLCMTHDELWMTDIFDEWNHPKRSATTALQWSRRYSWAVKSRPSWLRSDRNLRKWQTQLGSSREFFSAFIASPMFSLYAADPIAFRYTRESTPIRNAEIKCCLRNSITLDMDSER